MLLNKKQWVFAIGFIIGLLLVCTLPVYAYDPETGNLTEGEYYSVMMNPDYAYDGGSIENPVWYQPLKDYLIKFEAYFTDHSEDIETQIFVKKMVWKNNQYEEDDNRIYTKGFIRHFSKDNTERIECTLDPIKEYFKNNTDDINDFVPVGQGDHPDILNVTIDINGNGTVLDKSTQGYIAMTEDDLSDMKSTVGGQDYGFSLSGMGGEGGIGEIYASVGTGGERSGGMSDIFKYLFYALIPILFILSIFNMITKIFQ